MTSLQRGKEFVDSVVRERRGRVSYDFCNIKLDLSRYMDDRRCKSIVYADNIIGTAVVGDCRGLVCIFLAKTVVDIFLEGRA